MDIQVDENTSSLKDFAQQYGLALRVKARAKPANSRETFYAAFDGVEIARGPILTSSYADGASPEEALGSLASRLSGEVLVVDAHKPSRRTFTAPKLYHISPPARHPCEHPGQKPDTPMDEPETTTISTEALRNELSRNVYRAAVGVLESAEPARIAFGNGHHQAQDIALYALRVFDRHLRDEQKKKADV